MIDSHASPGTGPQRSPARAYIAVAASVAVLLTAGFFTYRAFADHEIRFEADTGSDTALKITWNTSSLANAVTPWSTTVTVKELQGRASVTVLAADGDTATCKIIVDGDTVADGSDTRAVGCYIDLATLD
ncbi:hypothetical protein [Actinoplanes sp. NPDC051851]|uniref:hypothetical protein n=1 Tax=Actinoplanes sp. NPDC051851 TaxID=3154753 RepID=UPI00341B3453